MSIENTTDIKSTITLFNKANFQLQNTIFSTQSPLLAIHFHQWWTRSFMPHKKTCMVIQNMACLSHCCCHCWNAPPTASMCWHLWFGLHGCPWMSEGAIFSSWKSSMMHFFFIHTSMLDAVLSDLASAIICHMMTI